MSSVLCNMKRVSITFLPFIPVFIRARVVQIPPYTSIKYATAANTELHAQSIVNAGQQSFNEKAGKDIRNFLTKPGRYFSIRNSQTLKIPVKNVDPDNYNHKQ